MDALIKPPARRRLLTAAGGLCLPFVHASRPAAARLLTFAGWSGLFQEIYEPAVLRPFERAHRDITVSYIPIFSPRQALDMLRRQRDHPEIDVVLLDLPTAWVAAREGLVEPLAPGSLPVLSDLGSFATPAGIAGAVLYTEPLVLLFDAAHVAPPTQWKALWGGPEGETLALPAPPDSTGIAFTATAARLFGGGDMTQGLRHAMTAIAGLAPRVVSWNPRPDVYRFIAGGGAAFGAGWNMPAQVTADLAGGRLGVAFPAEGTVSRAVTVHLVKGGGQPASARLLIAHLLSADAQKTMVERMFLGPVNSAARYPETALARTANTPARAARTLPVDWDVVEAMHDAIAQRWRGLMSGSG